MASEGSPHTERILYEVLPGSVSIDDGLGETRLDRPALERLRDLVAEGVFEVLLVTAPDRLARCYAYAIHQRLTVQGIPPRKSSPRGWAQCRQFRVDRHDTQAHRG